MQTFQTQAEAFRTCWIPTYVDNTSGTIKNTHGTAISLRYTHTAFQHYFYNPLHIRELLFPLANQLLQHQKRLHLQGTTLGNLTNVRIEEASIDLLLRRACGAYDRYSNKDAAILLLHVPRCCTALAEKAKQAGITDNKVLSLLLQTHKNHNTRVLKMPQETPQHEPMFVLLTNEVSPEYIYRVLALIPHLTAELMGITLSENVANIYSALGSQNIAEFNKAYENFINATDFVSEQIRTMLNGFLTGINNSTKERSKSVINNAIDEINASHNRIIQLWQQKTEHERILFALEHTPEANYEDFVSFVTKSKDKIKLYKATGSQLDLIVNTPMLYWDEEQFEQVCENNSAIKNNEVMKWLLENIFIKRRFTMITETQFSIDFNQSAITRIYNDINNSVLKRHVYFPHPHTSTYTCWGNNSTHISRALQKQDYIYAFTQIIAALSGINWYDGPVIRCFIEHLETVFYYGADYEGRADKLTRGHWEGVLIRDKDGTEYATWQIPKLYAKEHAVEVEAAPIEAEPHVVLDTVRQDFVQMLHGVFDTPVPENVDPETEQTPEAEDNPLPF